MDTWQVSRPDIDVETVVRWLQDCVGRGADGLTISGGEPFDQAQAISALLKRIANDPELEPLDILLYSGYTLEVLERRHRQVLELADAVISGPYVEGKPTELPWRGSANQLLSLLSARAHERFRELPTGAKLQLSVSDGGIWITGIPRHGDLARIEVGLAERGVALEDVSWRA